MKHLYGEATPIITYQGVEIPNGYQDFQPDDALAQKYDCAFLQGSVQGEAREEPSRKGQEDRRPQQLWPHHRSSHWRRQQEKVHAEEIPQFTGLNRTIKLDFLTNDVEESRLRFCYQSDDTQSRLDQHGAVTDCLGILLVS